MAGSTTFVTPDLGPDRPTHTSQAAGKQRGKRIVFVSLYFSVASVVKYGISITFFASHLYSMCYFSVFAVCSVHVFFLPFFYFSVSLASTSISLPFTSLLVWFSLCFLCVLIFVFSVPFFLFSYLFIFSFLKLFFLVFPCFNINFKEKHKNMSIRTLVSTMDLTVLVQ